MLEILWPVVDSQLASGEPLREPPGPASGPACTGRAKVVTGYPKRLLPNACTTPAQALIDIAGLPPAHTLGRRNGMHIPGSRPAQAGVRPTLKSTLQRSAPHPARGAVQPLADPVWGPALRRRVRGRRGTQADARAAHALLPSWCARAEQVPANPVRAARLRPALCAHPVRRLPGAPAGRTSTRLGAGSPPPLSAEGTLQAKAAACGLPAGMRTPAVTSAFAGASTLTGRGGRPALRRWMIRLRMSDGGTRPAATAQQCESLLDVAVRSLRGRTAPEPACPPNVRARPALTGSLLAWT
jgi:hypothetical protein